MSTLIVKEIIENRIFFVRGHKVMVDRDLAELYGVTTKVLNQAVKRNKKRFPADFMFSLTPKETKQLVTNCDRFKSLKHSSVTPRVFTEQGVAMLSSVLNSERAIQVNIEIMRTFVRLRQILATHKKLASKLGAIEKRLDRHEDKIQAVFEALRRLMDPPLSEKPKIPFGFHP